MNSRLAEQAVRNICTQTSTFLGQSIAASNVRRVTTCPPARKSLTTIAKARSVFTQAAIAAPRLVAVEHPNGQALGAVNYHGVHHIGILCKNLEASLEFYSNVLGLEVNEDRPHNKLPYRGAWLWIGSEMIHLMELPNPDPEEGRPEHGGRDRHCCVAVQSIEPLKQRLEEHSIPFTASMSGRPAVFFRDPDSNCLEVVEMAAWR